MYRLCTGVMYQAFSTGDVCKIPYVPAPRRTESHALWGIVMNGVMYRLMYRRDLGDFGGDLLAMFG